MRWIRLLPPLAWAGVIFMLSSIPNAVDGGGNDWRSSAAHVAFFAVLAYLVARGLFAAWPGLGLIRISTAAVVLATLYGVSDEWHQSFVPNRDVSALDVLFDAVGALIAVAIWMTIERLTRARGVNPKPEPELR